MHGSIENIADSRGYTSVTRTQLELIARVRGGEIIKYDINISDSLVTCPQSAAISHET
jgi:hypothetical protein